ncbi:MAG: class I tRNA ligase family protein, partial [Clostridia bacterium]|nr:class I tRNA ligase family protein [Clostridia bacterium]
MNRFITVCVAWPYANNNLHLGHISGLISGDVLARYHRMAGDNVLMVGGTDSHGTKPSIKAKLEGVTPKDIVDRYHNNFKETFDKFNFSYDLYSITYDPYHKEKVQEFTKKFYKNGYLYENKLIRPYCPHCQKFVADTEVEITCPNCGKRTKADSCDCGFVPSEKDLDGATCLVCGGKTEQRENKVLVFKLSAFRDALNKHMKDNEYIWRANSINETKKYLAELQDRDFSRDLDWGIS